MNIKRYGPVCYVKFIGNWPPPLPMEAKRNILIWCDFLKCEKINKKNGIHNLADLIDSNINKKNSNFFLGGGGNSTCNKSRYAA